MTGRLPFKRALAVSRRGAAAPSLALLVLAAVGAVSSAWADDVLSAADADGGRPPAYGPPGATPGVPSPEELEAAGAVIGQVFIDNQNIFNLEDPQDDNWLFRAADDLHPKTRADVIRHQLLFKP